MLIGSYTIASSPETTITAIEVSVLWRTCGKGQQDIGVHFFERRTGPFDQSELSLPAKFSTVLPPTPLSYDGQIVKIQWCARVRLLLKGNRQITEDLSFVVGHVGTDWMRANSGKR